MANRSSRSHDRVLTSGILLWGAGLAFALAGCGDPEVVVSEPLLAYVNPPHGSVGISTRVEPYVYFTHPVKSATKAEAGITLECRGAPPCEAPVASACPATSPAITVTYDSAAQLARVKPAADLAANMCYVTVVAAGIEAEDSDTGPLAFELRSLFQTR